MDEVLATYLVEHVPFTGVMMILGGLGIVFLGREIATRTREWLRDKTSDTKDAREAESKLRGEMLDLLERHQALYEKHQALHEECEATKRLLARAEMAHASEVQALREQVFALRDTCVCDADDCVIRQRVARHIEEQLGEITRDDEPTQG